MLLLVPCTGHAQVIDLEQGGASLSVGVGQSIVLEMNEDVSTVSIGEPRVADAAVGSARTVVVTGKGPGSTTLVVWEEIADLPQWGGYELVRVAPDESYAANCVRVNDRVLVAAGFPKLTAELERRGFKPLLLEMSEFQKMDGGLSCLSLRF